MQGLYIFIYKTVKIANQLSRHAGEDFQIISHPNAIPLRPVVKNNDDRTNQRSIFL